ncbi:MULTISPECIES: hypothetical protein [unclassified Caballeronia]|uniref:hypothetical protein n=1 Tax=unclassified Caballeronia TaxID=2646786 RepID=UPI002863710E|nr:MULTISPECIES: hypothetical protein [unclassified Caballeronia]MDR5774933.1 hypothetical protein [Caballeronia sp. LZ002]MDR5850369.1 hypothetical protein [Caballeronia sp. LZ003]
MAVKLFQFETLLVALKYEGMTTLVAVLTVLAVLTVVAAKAVLAVPNKAARGIAHFRQFKHFKAAFSIKPPDAVI